MKVSKNTIERMNAIEDYYYDHHRMHYRFFRNKINEVQFNLIGEEEPIEVFKNEIDLVGYITRLEKTLGLN